MQLMQDLLINALFDLAEDTHKPEAMALIGLYTRLLQSVDLSMDQRLRACDAIGTCLEQIPTSGKTLSGVPRICREALQSLARSSRSTNAPRIALEEAVHALCRKYERISRHSRENLAHELPLLELLFEACADLAAQCEFRYPDAVTRWCHRMAMQVPVASRSFEGAASVREMHKKFTESQRARGQVLRLP